MSNEVSLKIISQIIRNNFNLAKKEAHESTLFSKNNEIENLINLLANNPQQILEILAENQVYIQELSQCSIDEINESELLNTLLSLLLETLDLNVLHFINQLLYADSPFIQQILDEKLIQSIEHGIVSDNKVIYDAFITTLQIISNYILEGKEDILSEVVSTLTELIKTNKIDSILVLISSILPKSTRMYISIVQHIINNIENFEKRTQILASKAIANCLKGNTDLTIFENSDILFSLFENNFSDFSDLIFAICCSAANISCFSCERFYELLLYAIEENEGNSLIVIECIGCAATFSQREVQLIIEAGFIEVLQKYLEEGSFFEQNASILSICAMIETGDFISVETIIESGLLPQLLSQFDLEPSLQSIILQSIWKALKNEEECEGNQLREYINGDGCVVLAAALDAPESEEIEHQINQILIFCSE